MMWLTWRQQRLEAIIGGVLLAAVAALLLWSGVQMAAAYQNGGIAGCVAQHTLSQSCWETERAFQSQFGAVIGLLGWLILLPLVLGFLLAAPFAQELEQGTYRLLWTQSLGRLRWLRERVGLLLGAAATASLLLAALMAWWHGPLNGLQGRFDVTGFDLGGAVTVAHTVFAVALGLAAGALLRRTVPAMAVTLAGFVAFRVAVMTWLRPYYLPPLTATGPVGSAVIRPSDWMIGEGWRDHLGHTLSWDSVVQLCTSGIRTKSDLFACLNRRGIVDVVTYQPAGRFWLFQGIESALFLGLAAGLLALTAWWIKERMA